MERAAGPVLRTLGAGLAALAADIPAVMLRARMEAQPREAAAGSRLCTILSEAARRTSDLERPVLRQHFVLRRWRLRRVLRCIRTTRHDNSQNPSNPLLAHHDSCFRSFACGCECLKHNAGQRLRPQKTGTCECGAPQAPGTIHARGRSVHGRRRVHPFLPRNARPQREENAGQNLARARCQWLLVPHARGWPSSSTGRIWRSCISRGASAAAAPAREWTDPA
jgi:hypothetical protein